MIGMICAIMMMTAVSPLGQQQALEGTLVVAVPVKDGLVVCADKRLYNNQTGTFIDTFVKIRKADQNSLFVATNTVGFLDKQTGKLGFDVFEIAEAYVSRNRFVLNRRFWDGLKHEIDRRLREYLSKQKYQDWPATDLESNKLLFNLVFYSTAGGSARSHTIKVFYEKAPTPVIYLSGPVSETVRTPKLSGKGRYLMNHLAQDSKLSRDPFILRFDEFKFDIQKVTIREAVHFSSRLFHLANAAVPESRVSSVHDCALLGYENGFQWVNNLGQHSSQ